MPEGLPKRMLRLSATSYFSALVNLFVLSISIKYFPPETVALVAIIVLAREIFLSSLALAGCDTLARRLNEFEQINIIRDVRINSGIFCIIGGAAGGLIAFIMNFSILSIVLTVFYFVLGGIENIGKRIFLIVSKTVWYLPLINVFSRLFYALIVILFASDASDLIEMMIIAATASSFVNFLILKIIASDYLPVFTTKPIKLYTTNIELFFNKLINNIFTGLPTLLGNFGYSTISLTDVGFTVRSKNIARAAINPVSKSNSIVFGKALAQSFDSATSRFLLLLRAILVLCIIFFSFFLIINNLLPYALQIIGADKWLDIGKIFVYVFFLQATQGIYRFCNRTSWANISFIKISNYINFIAVVAITLSAILAPLTIELLILIMTFARLMQIIVTLLLMAKNDS